MFFLKTTRLRIAKGNKSMCTFMLKKKSKNSKIPLAGIEHKSPK